MPINKLRQKGMPVRRNFGALGLTATGDALLSKGAAVGATVGVSAIAAGAGAGSLAGPIGTVVGAVVGAVVGILTQTSNTASHIGSWDGGIVSALSGLPSSAAGIGRQIPWNENSHGLVQIIEALLAVGVYMAWDTSLKSNYDVCAHWAMTFGQAVQNVATAIVQKPNGSCTVSIPLSPGAGGHAPFNFTFTNPGVTVGPDKISATIIMGSSGLMAAMMTALGGQNPTNIASNATNASAQKCYALMLDYWFAQLAPAAAVPTTPVPPTVATAVQAASTAANTAAAAIAATSPPVAVPSPPPPATAVASATGAANAAATAAALASVPTSSTLTTIATTPVAATPVVASPTITPATETSIPATGTTSTTTSSAASTINSLLAQGASQNSAVLAAIQALEAQGVPTSTATVAANNAVAPATGLFGMSTDDLLILGGVAIAAILLLKKK